MFEFETSIARPSAYELHLRARRARSQAISGLSRHAVSKFADWLCMLVRNGGVRLVRQLAAEHRLRHPPTQETSRSRTLRYGLGA